MNIITVIGVFIIGITVKNLVANRLQERAAIEEVMAGRGAFCFTCLALFEDSAYHEAK